MHGLALSNTRGTTRQERGNRSARDAGCATTRGEGWMG